MPINMRYSVRFARSGRQRRDIFESRKRLIRETHYEQSYPPEYHCVRVRLYGRHQVEFEERSAPGDLPQVDRPPQSADGKDDGDSRFEESPVDEIPQRFLVDVLFFAGVLHLGV